LDSARALATIGVLSLALGLAACGSSSSGSTSTTQQAGGRRGRFSDPKVQACLKKEGVQVPDFRGGNGEPQSGSSGQRPNGGGFGNSAEAQKLRKALQKCGVTLPKRGQNGPPQGQGTTPSDTANS
jgi:hypothetical protein